jgi:hypothetical protein
MAEPRHMSIDPSLKKLEDLDHVCTKALKLYLADPWVWMREEDLVCWLHRELLHREGWDGKVAAEIAADPHRSRYTAGDGTFEISRLRREARFGKRKVDFVLHRQDGPKLGLERGQAGVRDLYLKVPAHSIDVFFEVKFYPDLYVKDGRRGWVDDLAKVQELCTLAGEGCVGGVLFVDTALPLERLGGYRAQSSRSWAASRREFFNGRHNPWPLPNSDIRLVHRGQPMTLAKKEELQTGGIYLWALSAQGRLLPEAEETAGKTLGPGEASITRWRLEV